MTLQRKPVKPLKRVALRQGTALKASRKPLPTQSERVRLAQPQRREVREVTKERSNGTCEAAHLLPTPCAGILETHEKLSRARSGGTSQYDASLTAALCSRHHQWATEHPTWAESVGLLLPSGPLAKSQILFDARRPA